MGNLCSIFHMRFKNLIQIIPSARKAQLVDYILLGWQSSTYKLKGSDRKWFMKPYSEIVEDTGIPISTLERYIKELNDEGFIERRQALYSRNNIEGSFEVKKGTYIFITNKLLSLLNASLPAIKTTNDIEQNDKEGDAPISNSIDMAPTLKSDPQQKDKNEGNEPLKMRGLYIRDLYSSFNNNITFINCARSVDKATFQRLTKQFESIQNFVVSDLKEEISDQTKQLVLGTFFNLTFFHKKQLSSPKQIVAEYLYSLINIDFYMPKVECFKFRNNILSKLIRKNNWRTPKGFYKHFYLGQNFKDKMQLREEQSQREKESEIKKSSSFMASFGEDVRLAAVEAQICEKGALIEDLTKSIYNHSSEEQIALIREKIIMHKEELKLLWDKQFSIEQELEQRLSTAHLKQCA